MDTVTLGNMAAEIVTTALKKKEAENGHLKEVFRAFGKTLAEQARWKATLPDFNGRVTLEHNREQFENGIPIADRLCLMRLDEYWPIAAERLVPALKEGFPKISRELERLRNALAQGFAPDAFLTAMFEGRDAPANEIAAGLDIEPDVLFFALYQIAKPVVEKRAEAFAPLVKQGDWDKGYCPICGSFPEMSLLRGKEGQRWLHCSFCSATWRYLRSSCPFCGSRDPDDREIFFVEGREHESSEVCHRCMRYLNSIDVRNLADEIVQEVMDISMFHMDAVVQQKGFKPMKGIGWAKSAL